MKFLRNHWYDIGVIPFAIGLFYLILNWSSTSVLQKIAIMNFMVIFWHQFEEYRFPGGEAAITNMANQSQEERLAKRYPLNQNNAMVINMAAAYIMYLLPVIFPNVMWIGFTPVVFGMSQLIVHVIMTPRKIGNKIYSPGASAVVFGHIPLGIWWLYYTISNGLLNWMSVVGGIVYLAVFIGGFMMKIGYGVLQSEDSKYVFPDDEFERGGYAERIRRLQGSNN